MIPSNALMSKNGSNIHVPSPVLFTELTLNFNMEVLSGSGGESTRSFLVERDSSSTVELTCKIRVGREHVIARIPKCDRDDIVLRGEVGGGGVFGKVCTWNVTSDPMTDGIELTNLKG